MNYAVDPESDAEDDEDAFKPMQKARPSKRRKTSIESDEDVFVADGVAESDVVEEGKKKHQPIESSDLVAETLWCR